MNKIKANETLNLEGVACPYNSSKALIKLEGMGEGEVLKIILDDGLPIRNVPLSIKDRGYKIIASEKNDNKKWELFVKKV